MKRRREFLTIIAVVAYLLSGCTVREQNTIKTTGREKVDFMVLPFNLTDVKLLDGTYLHATELNIKTLLAYEPDRLLARFYNEAGLKPKADQYMGWENESLAGHSLGHYLSACSMMFQTTGDKRFLERVDYIVSELKFLQDHDGTGYIGAFPNGKKILSQEVGKGDIRSHGFDLNGIWSPFYTQHKILAGLRDAWRLCGNEKALEVEKNFADWIGTVVIPLSEEQMQKVLKCEYGGISETFVDLYADTGDDKYLKLSGIFYDKEILDPLKNETDILPGKHCNTIIPKLIALSRLYELTGDSSDREAAEFFWNTVTKHHSYVTGGNGNDEYFGPADKLRNRLGEGTTESCNVYNMLKLTEFLFKWNPTASAADFYERALFNHILSTQNPQTGNVTYNLSLDMGGFKAFQDPMEFTCCIGTGMENHSKYGSNVYYHNDNELYVFQYIASELIWKEKGLKLVQETSFPEEQGSELKIICDNPVELAIMIRYPYWAENGIDIMVNGRRKKVKQKAGSFISIEQTWKTGDVININIPFTLRLESMPDDSNRVAVMYGPLVMAGDLGPLDDPGSKDAMYVPVMLTENRNPASWMKPVDGRTNTFITVNTGRSHDVEMRPFYSIYDRRYSVYWDLFNEERWEARQAEYKAELEKIKKIKESEIDFVQPGEMQPERNHNFKGEKTAPWSFNERPYREARGGWFSFDMKTDPKNKNALAVEYWGGFPGAKTFDIIANGKLIATENITNKKEGQFIFIQYDIPADITKGRNRITVKFQSHPNNTAGPVFGIRTIRQ
jgi:DUF1680 family protein